MPSARSSVANRSAKRERSRRRPVVQRQLLGRVDGRLGRGDGERRLGRDRRPELQRPVQRLRRRHDEGHEPEPLRLGGAEPTTGEHGLHRLRPADRPREPLRAAGTGDDARGPAPGTRAGRRRRRPPGRTPGPARSRRRGRSRGPPRSPASAATRCRPAPRSGSASRSDSGVWAASSRMSAPAAKARSPAPVITTARHVGSASRVARCSPSSWSSANDRALRTRRPVEGDERDPGVRGIRARREVEDAERAVGGVGHPGEHRQASPGSSSEPRSTETRREPCRDRTARRPDRTAVPSGS